ncbi:MAG TPA: SRPBCC domain-containing protein [Chthoniobacterales bacterium]|jgi:hypothetical protein|nr:SRPBCC domain-containing protein [Chthoniobacterales bacterium]
MLPLAHLFCSLFSVCRNAACRRESFLWRGISGADPHERIRYTDKFDDPNLPGEIETTINLKKVSCLTELSIVQEGLPAAIPSEMCYLGWQESLILRAKLVEAEIPD